MNVPIVVTGAVLIAGMGMASYTLVKYINRSEGSMIQVRMNSIWDFVRFKVVRIHKFPKITIKDIFK